MRPVWSGAIGFGLVSIPINVYSATQESTLDLDLLHKEDMGRIGYQKICKAEDKPVPNDEIVKGYEVSKNEYVILTPEEIAAAGEEKTSTIDIVQFIDEDEVDSIYFEKPYYLEPQKGGEKSYALLREALKKSKRAALAQFVMRDKAHLTLVKIAENDVLLLNIMRFPEEIRDTAELNIPKTVKQNSKEVELAMTLIDQLTGSFHPEEFKDTYSESLKKVIEDKAAGRRHVTETSEKAKPSNVRDIMGLLKASLEKNQSGKERKPPKRRSPKSRTTRQKRKAG